MPCLRVGSRENNWLKNRRNATRKKAQMLYRDIDRERENRLVRKDLHPMQEPGAKGDNSDNDPSLETGNS